MEMYEF